MKLIVSGHTVIDTVNIPGKKPKILPGGSAPAVATAAVQMGVNTGIFTVVGDDFPQNWYSLLQGYGIDCNGIIRKKGNTTKIIFNYNDSGDIDSVELDEGVSRYLDPADIPNSYLSARIMHICPLPPVLQKSFVEYFRDKMMILTMDFNQTYSREYREMGLPGLNYIGAVDIVFPNIYEAIDITGCNSAEEAGKCFIDAGVSVAVITEGRKGVFVYNGENSIRIKSFNLEGETTGCGDAFIGGFISSYIKDKDIISAARAGTTLASFLIEKDGSWAPKIDKRVYEERYRKTEKFITEV